MRNETTIARPGTRLVEVFADVLCPFTHVGLQRLVAGRSLLGRSEIVLRVRAWPLELVNGAPIESDVVAEEIDALRASVAPALFKGFDATHWPSTSLPALALAASGYRAGDRDGERVSLALRDALFERSRDISDPAVLERIAASSGIGPSTPADDAAVLADLEEGRARGVIGSPHFFIDGQGFFCPNLEIERVDGRLHVEIDREGLADFLGRCFRPLGSGGATR